MPRASIKTLQWNHRYVAIFKCTHKLDRPTEKTVSELVVAGGQEIKANLNMQRVLQRLQRDLIFKRLYHYANNPTSRLLTFRPYSGKQENEGRQRLQAMLKAQNLQEVQTQALELAHRYIGIAGVREGVLIFLISEGKLSQQAAENCIFVFKCDFEDVSQVTTDELFRQIQDAIVEQTKKGALYPYFAEGQFDDTIVRVFDELGQTQYWLEFLDLGERKPEYGSPQEVTVSRLSIEHPLMTEKYAEDFERFPPARSLVDRERLIRRDDRLSTVQVEALTEAVIDQTGEQRITLRLGEVRITAPLSQYGRTWIIAEEGDERYILIKGSNLENRTRMLTTIDLAEFGSLQQAAAELDISLP